MENSEWADADDFGFEEIKAPVDLPRKESPEKPLVQHEAICSVCKADYGILGVRYQCIFSPDDCCYAGVSN